MLGVFGFFVFAATHSMELPSTWTVSLPKPQTALERHQIAEYSGLLLIGDSFLLGGDRGILERRLLKSGEIIWSQKLQGSIQSTWVESDGSVFGGDTKGNFYRIRIEDGKILWTSKTKGAFLTQPLVAEGMVFASNSLGTLLAYDMKSGEWKWQQADPQPSPSAIWSYQGPSYWKGNVIVGFPSGNLQALKPENGELVWKESFNSASVSADGLNDIRSVVSNDELLAVSSYSGQLKVWQTVRGSKKLLWEKRLPLHSPALIQGDTLFYASKEGAVGAFDLQSGFERWKRDVLGGLATSPRVGGSNVWFGTSNGEIFVYSIDGNLKAHRDSVESPFWNPPLVVSDTNALFYSAGGVLRSIRIQ